MRIRFCLFALLVVFSTVIIVSPCFSQKLDIEATTSTYSGAVAPRHAAAVWIQTPGGELVNTVEVWSYGFNWCLMTWRTITFLLDTGAYDAITAATIPDHTAPIKIAWDCKDTAGNLVPDGDYVFCVEMTESEYWWKHNDPNEDYLGKFAYGTIAIDSQSRIAYGDTSDTCISNFKATYSPTAGIISHKQQSFNGSFLSYWYNSATQSLMFTLPPTFNKSAVLNIIDLKGKFVKRLEMDNRSKKFCWDLRNSSGKEVPSGVYLFEIRQVKTGKRIGSAQSITLLRQEEWFITAESKNYISLVISTFFGMVLVGIIIKNNNITINIK